MNSFAVNQTDVIFVNVTAIGRQVFAATLSGIASEEEVMKTVVSNLQGVDGLLTVNLRNSSQGTVAKRVVRLRRQGMGMLRAQMQGYAA